MPQRSPCSDAETLGRFLLGRCRSEEVVKLAAHVDSCPRCAELLNTLQCSDALLEAVQAAPPVLREPPAQLVEQLCSLRPVKHGTIVDGGGGILGYLGQAAKETPPELYAFLAPPRQPGEIGWLGPYRVLKVLGIGGMGVVFEAEDPQLRRLVALKTMRSLLSAQEEARQRFLQEARAAAAIEHEHVVAIYQVGEDGGVPYLAMQLLQGESLEDRLQRDGRLPEVEVVRIGREVAAGLAAAHDRGLIHRDVKPGNIFLEGRGHKRRACEPASGPLAATGGRVKLLDFGLARAAGGEPAPDTGAPNVVAGPAWTQVGTVVGTPAYSSPEQTRGEALDPRCDLFSLGCVLYRMCTGVVPFHGATVLDTLRAVQQEQPRPVRELNPAVSVELDGIIGKLLAKRREERYPSAQAVAAALEGITGLAPRRGRRRRIGVAATVAFVLGLAGYGLWHARPAKTVESTQAGDGSVSTSPAQSPACHFALAVDYPVGRQPYTVAVGDFNGDGIPDLVVSNIKSNTVSVLLGKGDGTFRPAIEYATGKGPHAVVVADFDGDGRLDIAVSNSEDNTVGVLLGNGDGSFRSAGSHATAADPNGLAVGDFNGDGKADLVVTCNGADTVSILLGNGDGSFRTAHRYTVQLHPISVAAADVNGDGKADLVVSTSGGDFVAVLLGNGDGSFAQARNFGVGSGPGKVVVGDFNGDGKPDVAVENFGSNDVSVLLGNGDGTFRAAVAYGAGTSPGGLATGDFNGDGALDLAVVNHNSDNVSVLLGRGDGTFRPAEHYALARMPAGVAVGDFNGDGRTDLAVVNHRSDTVSVLLNQLPAPHFRISTRREMEVGKPYRTIVTALDAWNNADPSYTGSLVMTSSDRRAILPASLTFRPQNHATIFIEVTFRTAGAQTLTVMDAANPLHHGRLTLLVAPRPAAHFRVRVGPKVVAGKPCEITVTAQDEFDNTDTPYDGTVHLTSNAPGAMMPADYTFVAGDEGRHVFRVIFPKEGEWTVTVGDTARRALTGSVKVRARDKTR
jgi:serine/threonine protein kinase